jgi:Flp pilus assembly pilin Flp
VSQVRVPTLRRRRSFETIRGVPRTLLAEANPHAIQEGQDLTEYGLLLVLLSLAAVGALGTLAKAINGTFTNAAANLTT